MIYTRTAHRYSKNTMQVIETTYTQPLKNRLQYKAFSRLATVVYFVPIHWFMETIVENFSQGLHSVSCKNNCGGGRVKENNEWKAASFCTRLSFCARIDLKIYSLDNAENFVLKEEIVQIEKR